MTTKERVKLICKKQDQVKIRSWHYDMMAKAKREKTKARHAKAIEECNVEIGRINLVLEEATA